MRPLFFVLGAAPEKDIFRKAGQGTLRYGTGFVYEVGGAGFGAAGAKGPAAQRTGGRRTAAPAPPPPLPVSCRSPGYPAPLCREKLRPTKKRICTPGRRQIRFLHYSGLISVNRSGFHGCFCNPFGSPA